MDAEKKTIDRRTVMRGALGLATLAPLGGALAGCASSGSNTSSSSSATGSGKVSADNPFGMTAKSSVSGANAIGLNTIVDQLEDLKDVFAAKNYEGATIKDTLYPGVQAPGTVGDKFAAINYVLTLYAIWYSDSLFHQNGWTVPKTWDEAIVLGAKAKAKGKYLFVWGKEAATYYQTLAISSAITPPAGLRTPP